MEWKSSASLTLLNLFQSVVINLGLFGISIYCAFLVAGHQFTVGDYVLLGSYFLQLMTPLNWLGTLYRVIQESFINMENMFDLMEEKVEVEDLPTAVELVNKSGQPPDIEFRDVSFGYLDNRQILEDVSFRISPGTSLAIVGSSGSGKSTIARLLFRLFDVKSGAVLVNGVDVR